MSDAETAPATGSADAPVTLTSAEADRVMKIQDTMIAAVRAATEAHKAIVARVGALETENARLAARVAELETHEPNVVDPAAMQPLLDDLAGAVAATHAAIAPHAAPLPEAGQGGDTQPQG